MPYWWRLLALSGQLHDLGEVQAIDASGLDRIGASPKYANRTNYTFQAMKTTILVDFERSAILYGLCSTKQPHDTKVGWQVLTRYLDRLDVVTADKGYDWADLRRRLRDDGVRPLIRHRVFDSLDWAQHARQDDTAYHRRSVVKALFVCSSSAMATACGPEPGPLNSANSAANRP